MDMNQPADRRAFLQAYDRCEELRRYLELKKPQEMHALKSFRTRMGDRCNYVTAILKLLWYDEVTNGSGDIQPHLRAAGLAA